jgi:RNA polymerase sigma-70 factor (ECF subfamily)
VSAEPAGEPGDALLELYDDALPQIYGYLLGRCRHRATAEDLTAETFMAAVDSIRRGAVADVTIAWLVGIARHKLVDHWRRAEREQRRLEAVAAEFGDDADDPWDAELDTMVAHDVLDQLGAHHRIALSLRYVDGLPVPDVAALIDRTVHATEALLVRARLAFRRAYEEVGA